MIRENLNLIKKSNRDFNYWENIIMGIWEKFNDIGYSKFIEKYWEYESFHE